MGPLFEQEAQEAMSVFGSLPIVDAGGAPMSKLALPWSMEFASTFFGAYDSAEGRRLITEFFFCVSKKNFKSGLAAGFMLTSLVRNWRESGEFGILAPTKEAADNAFKPARDMVRKHPTLSELIHVQDHIRMLTHRVTGATLKVVAADSDSVSGKKWIGTFVDELWAFGKRPGAADMLLEATGGMASRPEGFVVYATTQSDDEPSGVFKEKLDYARSVRDGKIEDSQFLPLIYEFPKHMIDSKAYLDRKNFYISNPNIGASVTEDFIDRKIKQAGQGGEESIQGVLAKHLNIQIGLNLRSGRWPGADHWAKRADKSLTLESLIDRSDSVTVGVDGGGMDDMLGLCVYGRDAMSGERLAWCRAWIHRIVLERRKSEAARFQQFAEAGQLRIIDDDSEEDIEDVAGIVGQIVQSGKLFKVGVDPYGIGAIVDALTSDECGVEAGQIAGVSQGWKLTGAVKTCERKLASGGLIHDGSELMNWCVGNAKLEQRGNAVYVTKQASGTGKIDPLMAMFNAETVMSLAPAQNVIGSDYEMVAA